MTRLTLLFFISLNMTLSACVHTEVWATEEGEETDDSNQKLRVVTYNVNFGLAGDPGILNVIESTDADIIALQETNQEWQDAVESSTLAKNYPHIQFHHCCRAGGLALISRYPFTIEETIDGVDGWFPAWRVNVDAPTGELQLLVLHLRPPVSNSGSFLAGYFLAPDIHTEEIEKFTASLDWNKPTVALGDYNESPRGAAIAVFEERGFTNALPQFDDNPITWHWPTRFGELRNALDHILVSEHFHVSHAEVRHKGRSDHFPVIADIQLKSTLTTR